MRIVVVEDEPAIADFLVRGLEAAGYEVALATDGEAGERLILDGEADLVVLDVMLPGRRRARGPRLDPPGPAAAAGDHPERQGRGRGPDRRTRQRRDRLRDEALRGARAPGADPRPPAHRRGRGRPAARGRARGRPDQPAGLAVGARRSSLSPREFALLACFARHPGQALSRDRLLSEAWGYDHDPGTNVVDVYVGYLRRKLGDPSPIETVRSAGYRLQAGEEA